jgi:hypothetical protein
MYLVYINNHKDIVVYVSSIFINMAYQLLIVFFQHTDTVKEKHIYHNSDAWVS